MKALSLLAVFFSLPALAGPVDASMNCMIHDATGKVLADLGTVVGVQKDGSYKDSATVPYGDLAVKINLVPASHDAPEVAGPVLKVCFQKGTAVVAKAEAAVNAGLDLALWEPSEDLFLHCL